VNENLEFENSFFSFGLSPLCPSVGGAGLVQAGLDKLLCSGNAFDSITLARARCFFNSYSTWEKNPTSVFSLEC
jgi:hypothetical protein